MTNYNSNTMKRLDADKPRSLGIVLSHGAFHIPSCFDEVKRRLEAAGFSPVIAVRHPSVGTDPNITVEDDGHNIRVALDPYLDQGKDFLAIAHSYGGTPLTIAAQGYSKAERQARGIKGGIRAVIFVTSNIPQKKGDSALSVLPPGLDIVDFANGLATANAKAREAFYGPHMADDVADSFMSALLPQSEEALLGPVSVGLEDLTVPAYYVICENDQAIDPDTQRNIVDMIPTLKRVLHNPGGHSAFITHVNEFIDQVLGIADELEIWD